MRRPAAPSYMKAGAGKQLWTTMQMAAKLSVSPGAITVDCLPADVQKLVRWYA